MRMKLNRQNYKEIFYEHKKGIKTIELNRNEVKMTYDNSDTLKLIHLESGVFVCRNY